ncbi:hypothetical protein WEH80_01410 [Actinomycetes bacterium KLBMP 9759]
MEFLLYLAPTLAIVITALAKWAIVRGHDPKGPPGDPEDTASPLQADLAPAQPP